MVKLGITPKSFILGVGPKLYSKVIGKGTLFTLRPLPIAGGVDPGNDADIDSMSKISQFKIYFGGVWYNILSAIPIGIVLAYQLGYYSQYNPIVLTIAIVLVSILIPILGWIWLFSTIPLAIWSIFGRLGEISNVDVVNGNIVEKVGFSDVALTVQITGFFYLFSLLVAAFNMIPLLGLDGWHILKMFVKDRFPRTWKGYNIVGGIILAIMVVATILNDTMGIVKLF